MSSEIGESSNLVDRIDESFLKEYEQHTYEQLSQEFEELYPAAARAFELIPLMYNRLTLVDGLTHRKAVAKTHNDHNHLSGFTERNIRRQLDHKPENPLEELIDAYASAGYYVRGVEGEY